METRSRAESAQDCEDCHQTGAENEKHEKQSKRRALAQGVHRDSLSLGGNFALSHELLGHCGSHRAPFDRQVRLPNDELHIDPPQTSSLGSERSQRGDKRSHVGEPSFPIFGEGSPDGSLELRRHIASELGKRRGLHFDDRHWRLRESPRRTEVGQRGVHKE